MKRSALLAFVLTPLFLGGTLSTHAAEMSPSVRTFPITVSEQEIKAKYQSALTTGEKVKILVMPGHEPDFGGAELAGLKERDIAVDIANKLASELATDPRLIVTVARSKTSWNDDIQSYFDGHWKAIQKLVKEKKKAMQKLVKKGQIDTRSFAVDHNTAAPDSAYRLYGITKWANENDYDIVVHVHLNDNVGAQFQSGFAVYVPDHQFGNAQASIAVGTAIANELNRFNASSTIPIENYGIVEDQELIALGAYNTAEFASVLVEYAYIYESKIANAGARRAVTDDMAYQTYRGLMNFFGVPSASDTLILPYAWAPGPLKTGDSHPQVYALQVALHKLGFYPPSGQLLIGCPISGTVGECTTSALRAFQKSKGWEPTGSIGTLTAAALKKSGF